MMLLRRMALLACLPALGAAAWGAPAGTDPYIGYVYPAGGQSGTTFRVTVAGQRIQGTSGAYVSGKGVHTSVIAYEGPGGPLNRLQQEELKRQVREIMEARFPQLAGKRAAAETGKSPNAGKGESEPRNTKLAALPDLPELRNLKQMTVKQLRALLDRFANPAKRRKPPIAEAVTLEVTVEPDAAPGDREIRLQTPRGLSNPLVFQIGQIPETREADKDDGQATLAPEQPPVVLNGQIMPGEVDRFPLQLKQGQKLVVAVQARKLIPYLADAVPGWFQAVVSILGPDGEEVAFDDDCGFDPDPALTFQPPKDGRYTLEIRDAVYRGREDFVYRVDVGPEPVIKALFPRGSRGGVPIGAARLDREAFAKTAREYLQTADLSTRERAEAEPNDTGQKAMQISPPQVISGAISKPGDKDVFRFQGEAGDVVVAEVCARRAGSPLDSLLRLMDAKGRVVAWNDDHEDMLSGLLTHDADSYLSAKLPAAGQYFVQLSDAQGHGGADYLYCMRITPPRPDFELVLAPSCLNVAGGRTAVATVYACRKDGWDGDIDIALKGAPKGFTLSGARIPRGRDHVRMTLTAPVRRFDNPIALHVEGSAMIGGKTVTHSVVPADDLMQAFAYHHLVPSGQLLVTVPRGGGGAPPSLDLPDGDRARIPAGGSVQVAYSLRTFVPKAAIHLELSDPPPGVSLEGTKATRDGFTLVLKADDKHAGYADNLIVEAFAQRQAEGDGKAAGQKQRMSLGVLPALPFEIVKQGGTRQ